MKRNLTSLFSLAIVFGALLMTTAMAQETQPPREQKNPRGKVVPPLPSIPASVFRITVPFERDDLGSDFHIDNGSVLTAVTAMGSFTARDTATRAIIPYPGESTLKFTAGIIQEWTPPNGVTWIDILKMRRNAVTGQREFYTDEPAISSFATSGGPILMPMLAVDEFMIRARTKTGKLVFMPLSIRGDK